MFSHIDKQLNEMVKQLPEGPEGFITPEQAEFLYAFIRLNRPRFVAETGFHTGHSACVIMRAMETYGGGTLVSFDIGKYEPTQKAADIVKAKYEDFHYVVGDTKQTLSPTLVQILNTDANATLDLAIVDGGHDVETAKNDLLIFESLVKPGGYIWLDDFENTMYVCIGVSVVGREFAASRRNCMRFVTADNRGMMLYQKGF